MTRQFSINSARLTEPSPSARPSALDMPRLVVASASKPSDCRSLAVPASHGLGRIRILDWACRSLNRRPFSACVGMVLCSLPAKGTCMDIAAQRELARLLAALRRDGRQQSRIAALLVPPDKA